MKVLEVDTTGCNCYDNNHYGDAGEVDLYVQVSMGTDVQSTEVVDDSRAAVFHESMFSFGCQPPSNLLTFEVYDDDWPTNDDLCFAVTVESDEWW